MRSRRGFHLVGLVLVIVAIALVVTLVSYNGKSNTTITKEAAVSDISTMLRRISLKERSHNSVAIQLDDMLATEDELPDIDVEYPVVVQGRADINVEIWTSPEKGGTDTNGFLTEMAKRFNSSNVKTADGRRMGVTLRSIASGTGVEYITSGKAVPTAFTPSNDLWGKMIEYHGVNISVFTDKVVGNTAGILVKKEIYDMLVSEYGEANFNSIYQATVDGKLKMGYTNPYSSSTGLNFLLEALYISNHKDMLSADAVSKFSQFQANVPLVAYTTQQMVTAAEKGVLDGTVTEYQSYINDSTLQRLYKYIPFGYHHNNPLYTIGFVSDAELEVLTEFVKLCEENAALATKYGFNAELGYDDSSLPEIDGNIIAQAQGIWKESKDNGVPIICEFVMDISGSMAGEPINNLKTALLNSMNYIGMDNYIGLISFNSDVYNDVEIAQYNLSQQAAFKGALYDLTAGGNTAMYDALIVAVSKVQAKMDELGGNAKPMIIVLTDGESNSGYGLHNTKDVLAGVGIPVYTISYNGGAKDLETLAAINEAASMNCTSDDIVYKLRNLFNAQL